MRNTVIGLALALLFLAGLFALPRFSSHENIGVLPAQVAARVEPGFSGVRKIGPWILACAPAHKKAVPLPFSFGPAKTAASAAGDQPLGRCRTFMAFHRKDDPKQVVLMLTFRVLGRAEKLAVLIRIPPVAKKGDIVLFRLGQRVMKLPVSVCQKGSCVAAGALLPKQEAMLYGANPAELLLPAAQNGKRLAVRVPMLGLRPAISAMRRAQVGD